MEKMRFIGVGGGVLTLSILYALVNTIAVDFNQGRIYVPALTKYTLILP